MKILFFLTTFVSLWAALAGRTFNFRPGSPSPVTPVPSPEPTKPSLREFSLSDFRYPGAEVVFLSGSRLSLKSQDSPEEITNWYKKKITDLSVNVRNFVQTNTNGEISNQLVGAGAEGKVRIEISKARSASGVEILVTINE